MVGLPQGGAVVQIVAAAPRPMAPSNHGEYYYNCLCSHHAVRPSMTFSIDLAWQCGLVVDLAVTPCKAASGRPTGRRYGNRGSRGRKKHFVVDTQKQSCGQTDSTLYWAAASAWQTAAAPFVKKLCVLKPRPSAPVSVATIMSFMTTTHTMTASHKRVLQLDFHWRLWSYLSPTFL